MPFVDPSIRNELWFFGSLSFVLGVLFSLMPVEYFDFRIIVSIVSFIRDLCPSFDSAFLRAESDTPGYGVKYCASYAIFFIILIVFTLVSVFRSWRAEFVKTRKSDYFDVFRGFSIFRFLLMIVGTFYYIVFLEFSFDSRYRLFPIVFLSIMTTALYFIYVDSFRFAYLRLRVRLESQG
jgi:hypothetical protein